MTMDDISAIGIIILAISFFSVLLCLYINFYEEVRRELLFRSGIRSSRISPELLHTISLVIRARQTRQQRMSVERELESGIEMTQINKKYENAIVIINPGGWPSLGTYELSII
jgi:hypothetical protein